MLIFSTAWYGLNGAKFPDAIYEEWMSHMLTTVAKYYLVVYTDNTHLRDKYAHSAHIHWVIMPLTEFTTYKTWGPTFWMENHYRNRLLNNGPHKVDWRVVMLWCEKVFFVEKTVQSRFFGENADSTWYGWIDIGYFRCRPNLDVPFRDLPEIPADGSLERLNKGKIHYNLVCTERELWYLQKQSTIPDNQISFGGGCFLAYSSSMVDIWRQRFFRGIQKYASRNKTIKDDQIIIVDCFFTDGADSCIEYHCAPNNYKFDRWFYFTSLLLLGH